jgi:hypothetical protein
MLYQIFKKLLIVLLCLSLLSSLVLADDLTILEGEHFNTFGNLTAADYGVTSVSYSVSISATFSTSQGRSLNHPFAMSSDSPSNSYSTPNVDTHGRLVYITYESGTVVIPAGTLTVTLPTSCSVSTSAAGASVSVSGSTLTVVSDGSTSPIPLSFSSRRQQISGSTGLRSVSMSSSFVPAEPSGPDNPPVDEYAGTGSMFGWTGQTLFTLRFVDGQHWYTNGTGSERVGHLDVVVETTEAQLPGYYARTSMLAALTYQKWKWKVDEESGLPKFDIMQEQQGSWADMLYRTSVYNYFWGNKLWNNDVSDSWYGSISSDFSYLNYRVNQILDVLANDEDLAIKDATTPEREWVKGYFTGSGDKADSSKYDSLNSDGQALKDFLTPSESASMSDALAAVESQGYSFWSESVYQDINQTSSTATTNLGDDVPWEEQINDLYSEHVASIWGAFYD